MRTRYFLAAFVCLFFMQLCARRTISRQPSLEKDAEKIFIESDYAQKLINVLEKIVSKAPRLDAPDLHNAASPIAPFDCAELDVIRRCVCLIKKQLKELAESLSIHDYLVHSHLDDIESKIDECCEVLNSKVDVVDDTVDRIESKTDECCEVLNSKVDVVDDTVDRIESKTDECCEVLNSKVDVVDDTVDRIESKTDECCEVLNSKVDVVDDTVDRIESKADECCEELNSKVDVVDDTLDRIESKADECCEELSSKLDLHDELINSKIGDLDDEGSCFESCLNVPADINNAQLTVIQWLKSIMLTLHGCNDPIGCNTP